jgi:histidinol-phosphate/aromatic aminotransferase/cobyric acid decarboxylase-like protein
MQRETVYAEFVEDEKWAEVDDPNDLNTAEFVFNKDKRLDILQETFGGYWNHDITDFCFIRNMYFPNSSIISEMRNNLPNLVFNYGSRQSVLNQKLAYFLLCDVRRLMLLNGASQIYPILQDIFAGKKVLIPSPTFGEYSRVFKNYSTYSDRVGINLDDVLQKCSECDVIVFTNPNNPTGSFVDSGWIYNFARENPSKQVIVDESFIDFANQKSVIDYIEDLPQSNIIVIKSLSKSLGVPGIRLGFVYSSDQDFMGLVKGKMPIWNSNSLAEFYLEIILKHRKSLNTSFQNTIRDKEAFIEALSKQEYISKAYHSHANYILVRFKSSNNKMKEFPRILLDKKSLYVKDVSDKINDGSFYLRIAVRTPQENQCLISAMNEVLGENK